jgi:hypothetical protein
VSVFLSVFGEGGRTGGGGGVPVDPPTNLTLPYFDVGSSTVIGGEWLLNPGEVGGAVTSIALRVQSTNNIDVPGTVFVDWTAAATGIGVGVNPGDTAFIARRAIGPGGTRYDLNPAGLGPMANPGSGYDLVTLAVVVGNTVVPVTSPAAANIGMPTNGAVLRLETGGAATAIDLTKVTVTVSDVAYEAGVAVTRVRTLYVQDEQRKPYNEGAAVVTSPGTFHLLLTDFIYNEDATHKTTITSINFAAGWIPGAPAGTWAGTPVRLDSLAYPRPAIRPASRPYLRDAGAGLALEFVVVCPNARLGRSVYSVAAWQRQGAVDGPVARSTAEVRSVFTPAAGRNPSGFAAPAYQVAVARGALPDGEGEIRYQVEPWLGPVRNSVDFGDDWPTVHPPKGLPYLLDTAGVHTPVYAWVNDNEVAGGAPAVQTGTADPGSAASYATFNDAATALQAYNNGRGHNDTSGGVIMLRAVAGSAMGDAATAYCVKTSMSARTAGILPLVVEAVGGAPGAAVRLCGLQRSAAAANRVVMSRMHYRFLTFDGVGQTANNIIVDGTSAGAPSTKPTSAAARITILEDCDVVESDTGSVESIYRPGFRYDYRVNHQNASQAGAFVAGSNVYGGVLVTMGSYYRRATSGSTFDPFLCAGSRFVNHAVAGVIKTPLLPTAWRDRIVTHVRVDHSHATAVPLSFLNAGGATGTNIDGLFLRAVFARHTATGSIQTIRISADTQSAPCHRALVQGFSSDAGAAAYSDANGRANFFYDDTGYGPKDMAHLFIQASFCPSWNMKSDYFLDSTQRPANGGTQHNGALSYRGTGVVWDTPAAADGTSRVYRAKLEVPAGTALTDAGYWEDRGLVALAYYNLQSGRVGNYLLRNGVGCYGNVANGSANYNTLTYDSWLGETWSRGGIQNGGTFDVAYEARASAADVFALGDYRPKAGTSPLLNRIPAGRAYAPFDILGVPIPDDGTGSAGAYQRAA